MKRPGFPHLSPLVVSRVAIVAVFILAGMDLIVRLFDIPFFKNSNPRLTAMKIITAGFFLVSAAALVCLRDMQPARWKNRITLTAGAFIGTAGLLTVLSYVIEAYTGSQWSWVNNPFCNLFLASPSRMSVISAVLFSLFGCVLITLSAKIRPGVAIGHIVLLPVSMLSYFVIIGYLFDIKEIYTWLGESIALNSSLAFWSLCVAAFCVRPDSWFMKVFTGEEVGSLLSRRLLPFLLILPLVIGWFRLQGERSGFFGSEVGVALVAVTYTVCFLWLVWLNAHSLNRTDRLRRRAEASLREKERMLNKTQEISHLGSWQLDLVNNVLSWSDEVYRIFGLEPREFGATYEAFINAVHPEDRAAVDAAYSASLREDKNSYELEHRIVRKSNGEIRIVYEKCEHIRNETGKIVQSIGMVHDITERKKAEELLRYNASLLDNISEAAISTDINFTILRWNRAAEEMYGWRAEEVVGQSSMQILSTRYFDNRSRDDVIRSLREHGCWKGEVIQRRKNGSPISIAASISMLKDSSGKNIGVVSVNRNITESKLMEDELKRAKTELEQQVKERTADLQNATNTIDVERRRLNNVLEMLPAYVVLLTPDYHVKFANRYFTQRFGESRGRRCFEFLFGRAEPCETCETYVAMKTNKPHHWEWTGPDNRNYDIHDFIFSDVDGQPLIMEMGIDITDRKKAEAALIEANEMRLLGQLTSGVAHEERNPLSGIMAIMGGLAKELADKDRFQPYMQHMRIQVSRLTTLMEDLLTLGRPLREENMHEVSIVTLVENALSTWLQTLQEPKPPVRFIKPEKSGPYTIRADGTNMTQMIINLLENAHNHSPEGAEIVCSIHEQIANTVVFCIKDRGPGIAKDILPRLFDPFFTTRKGGTGLGLCIVRRVVENHQGSVFTYNNTDGPGATFEVSLPLYIKT